jgi:hypothetical protein
LESPSPAEATRAKQRLALHTELSTLDHSLVMLSNPASQQTGWLTFIKLIGLTNPLFIEHIA